MVPEEIQQTHHDASDTIYPIQFVQVGNLHSVPAPLVRVSTCGEVTLEVLHKVIDTEPAQGFYRVVTPQQRRKGSSSALNLLKVLVSLPGHTVSKDWLSEHFPRNRSDEEDEEGWVSLVRVDNIVSLLRSLLCPPGIVGEETLRKALITFVKNHRESGPSYRLAAEPLLWLDVDVIAASVQQACLLEQQGKDALPYWEQAYTLASKGSFLRDEPYSDWARDKCLEIEGYLRQAVHALHRLYLARDGEAGEERVLLLLRSYWQTHPTDEDLLRPLLELLGKRDCVQEALDYYQRLCERLEKEGGAPDIRTQKTVQNLHTRQRWREHTFTNPAEVELSFSVVSAFGINQQDKTKTWPPSPFSYSVTQVILESLHEQGETLPLHITDLATRRAILSVLCGIPFAAWMPHQEVPLSVQHHKNILNEDLLTFFESAITSLWELYYTGGVDRVEQGLSSLTREIANLLRLAQGTDQHKRVLILLTMGYQLQCCVLRDRMDYPHAHIAYQRAFDAAQELGNAELTSSALAREGVTLIQQEKPEQALLYLNTALHIMDGQEFPLLKGYILQALSEAYAKTQQVQECWRSLDEAESSILSDQKHSLVRFNKASIMAQRGVDAVLLKDYQEAIQCITASLMTYDPTLVRGRARLIAQRAEAYYGLGKLDVCIQNAEEAFTLAQSVGSSKTISRIEKLYASLSQSPWRKEGSVARLGARLYQYRNECKTSL
jgi:tetratricopeptide (TPR) repeat protein